MLAHESFCWIIVYCASVSSLVSCSRTQSSCLWKLPALPHGTFSSQPDKISHVNTNTCSSLVNCSVLILTCPPTLHHKNPRSIGLQPALNLTCSVSIRFFSLENSHPWQKHPSTMVWVFTLHSFYTRGHSAAPFLATCLERQKQNYQLIQAGPGLMVNE